VLMKGDIRLRVAQDVMIVPAAAIIKRPKVTFRYPQLFTVIHSN